MRASTLLAAVIFIAAATRAVEAQEYAVVVEKAPVYLYATTARQPLTTLDVDTVLRVLDDVGYWIRVEFRDTRFGPRVGFVEKRRVRISRVQDQPINSPVTVPPPTVPPPTVPLPTVPPPTEPPRPLTPDSTSVVSSAHVPLATVTASRLSAPIAIDGKLSEESWLTVPIHESFRQREPEEGKPATERTELKVAYDDDALYIGLRLFDSEPARIMRRLSRRDEGADADEVTVFLDPYHDHISGVLFEVSAAGVQRDAKIFDDYNQDSTWDAVWLSAVSVDSEGWVAELKIPFSQIRFVSSPSQTWGINVSRTIHRKAERDWLELVPRSAPFLASRMAHLTGLNDVEPRSHIEFLPYGTARSELVTVDPDDPFRSGRDVFGSGGVDVKWGIMSNLTLDATFNPDFGQVEVDPSVVNLTEFESFFEEKRPFFLEGAQIFQTPAENMTFYTRRIGRPPQGFVDGQFVDVPSSTTILGAAKLTGRTANGWTLGILDAVTGRENASAFNDGTFTEAEVEPLTNYFVARLLKDGQRGGVGSLVTAANRVLRTESLRQILNSQAYVAAADGYLFLDNNRDWVVRGETATSWLQGDTAAVLEQQESSRRYYQRPDASYVELDPNRTSLGGWRGLAGAERQSGKWRAGVNVAAISPGFESNDLGFQPRADTISANASFSLGHFDTDRVTREREVGFNKSYGWNFGGEQQVDGWEVSGSATFLNYWEVQGSVGGSRRTLDDHLTRGGPLAAAPATLGGNFEFESDDRKAVTLSGEWEYRRDDADGWANELGIELKVKFGERFELSTEPTVARGRDVAQHIDAFEDPFATDTFGARYVFGEIDQTEVSMTTRLNVTFSPKLTLQLYVEPFIASGSYSRFKEFARPRTFDFFEYGVDRGTIAYDESEREYEVDPDGAGPAKPFRFDNEDFNEKSLIAKAVLRWEWRLGSTLYVVWTQQREHETDIGEFDLGSDANALFGADADNIFLIKMSYWFSR